MRKDKKKKRTKRIILIIVLALIAAALVLGLISLRNRNNKAYVQRVGDVNCSWVLSNSFSGGTVRLPVLPSASVSLFFYLITEPRRCLYGISPTLPRLPSEGFLLLFLPDQV